MKPLLSFLKDLTTTKDGESFDVIRVGLIVGGTSLIGLSAFAVIVNKQGFDPMQFGTGLAALFAGGGLGIGAKRKDEPEA